MASNYDRNVLHLLAVDDIAAQQKANNAGLDEMSQKFRDGGSEIYVEADKSATEAAE